MLLSWGLRDILTYGNSKSVEVNLILCSSSTIKIKVLLQGLVYLQVLDPTVVYIWVSSYEMEMKYNQKVIVYFHDAYATIILI